MAVHELYLSFEARLAPALHTIDGPNHDGHNNGQEWHGSHMKISSYDSSKVVEVSRAVCWHEHNTLVLTSYGCFVLRGGYHTLFMIFVNDLEQKMAWVSYENLEISSMGAQN